jgi:hypothetical protein
MLNVLQPQVVVLGHCGLKDLRYRLGELGVERSATILIIFEGHVAILGPSSGI